MANVTLQEIETQVNELPVAQRLLLIERLIHGLRTVAPPDDGDAQMAAMAADPQIQRELATMNQDFADTEMDGLEPEQWP